MLYKHTYSCYSMKLTAAVMCMQSRIDRPSQKSTCTIESCITSMHASRASSQPHGKMSTTKFLEVPVCNCLDSTTERCTHFLRPQTSNICTHSKRTARARLRQKIDKLDVYHWHAQRLYSCSRSEYNAETRSLYVPNSDDVEAGYCRVHTYRIQ